LKREGFRHVAVLGSPEEIAAAEVARKPLWNNRRHDSGPFDIVGDVHGCFDEAVALLRKLGYRVQDDQAAPMARHPEGRRAFFVGDLVDRGPKSPAVLRLVMAMVGAGTALCIPGNHDIKLKRKLDGRDVRLTRRLAETLAQLEAEPAEFVEEVRSFIGDLVSHCVLDGGKLVVAHAGMKESLQGRASARVRELALYGETDEYGLPVRHDWAADYRGRARVVYGHTPVAGAEWINNSICIDTGCVFGGALTALRYPENELVSVSAARMYYEPVKPLAGASRETTERPLMRGKKGLVQPALKCRGKEYLRIVYGPEYTLDEHLERLRGRGLGAKRSLALREFALGLEGLHRFVEKEPLYRVHECVFGVLALESEPVDPRL
jgi:protein phosphatase